MSNFGCLLTAGSVSRHKRCDDSDGDLRDGGLCMDLFQLIIGVHKNVFANSFGKRKSALVLIFGIWGSQWAVVVVEL